MARRSGRHYRCGAPNKGRTALALPLPAGERVGVRGSMSLNETPSAPHPARFARHPLPAGRGEERIGMPRYRVTVDTGGTFSDFVHLDEATGAVTIAKVTSTPDDPSRAIIQGVEGLLAQGVAAEDIAFFCHGTTVGTNALLEGKGARTGLLVTEGFRGIYPVGEQSRPYGPAIFDVMFDKPEPLVPQSRTGEVKERVDFRGRVLRALDEAALRETVRALEAERVESIAVCLLFAFLRPAHEQRVREIVAQEMPDASVSLSCEVLPQIREYFRLSTTV